MAVTGFGEIAEKLRRSTVLVHAGGRGSGSGVIWSSDGSVITNAHVARAGQLSLQLWDGREFSATVTSRDPSRDLALLRIAATNLPSVLVADSSQVRPGELAIAIGNPMGFVGALTTGVIHAVGPLRGLGSRSWVQADVRLGTEEKAFSSPVDLSQALQGKGPRTLRLEFLRGDYFHIRRVTVQLGNQIGSIGSRSSAAA